MTVGGSQLRVHALGDLFTLGRMDNHMETIGLLIAIVLVWFVLNRWVLPRFGVST